jgi:hypothetical protein
MTANVKFADAPERVIIPVGGVRGSSIIEMDEKA